MPPSFGSSRLRSSRCSGVSTSAIRLSASCSSPQRAARTDKAPSPVPDSSNKHIFTLRSAFDAVMRQHGVQLRLAATEAFEQFHRLLRTTARQDVIKERLAGFAVEDPLFFEAGVRIRCQHVGPQVAVVPCRIAAGKNMAEGMRETAPCRTWDDRDLF